MTKRRKPSPPPAPKRATIDRFEDALAVLVADGRTFHLQRSQLPEGAQEGDVVDLVRGEVDAEATRRLRERVQQARERASGGRKPPSGSFDL